MSNAWDGKSKAHPLGYRIFLGLLKYGGRKSAYKLLPFVTLWYKLFVPKATAPLRYLYQHRMGFSQKKTAQLISKNLTLFGQGLIDKFAVLSGNAGNLEVIHHNILDIEEMLQAGRGGFIISAHLGNFEAAGHMLQRFEAPVNVVMFDGEAEQVKSVTAEKDAQRSFNIIALQEDGSHIYEITAALNRNELICINADRFRPGNRIMEANFFGKKAQFPAGPFILGAKLKAPVLFTFAIKQDDNTYINKAYPAKTYEGRGMTGAEEMLKDFVSLLEKELRETPEQWFNYYPFWNELEHT